MSWSEFSTLLSGLMHDTPLGQIISIRSETDKEVIKNFTKEQKKIRSDWKMKQANNKKIDEKEYKAAMENFKNMFKAFS